MKVWMVRGGRHGEVEERHLREGRIYLRWFDFHADLTSISDRKQIRSLLRQAYPNAKEQRIIQNSGQFLIFCHKMQIGDLVLMPRKGKGLVSVGTIASDYRFDKNGEDGFQSYREVQWRDEAIPKAAFDSELQHKLNAATTFCGIKGDQILERVKKAIATGEGIEITPAIKPFVPEPVEPGDEPDLPDTDLEDQARDGIRQLIQHHFKGHGFERLIRAILEAQGYTTYLSPVGSDKGVDILAGRGPLGFENPRICVQVKSEAAPIGRQVLDQLIGVMQNVQAEQGLLVSWSGFKKSVEAEEPAQFFRVRLWNAETVIDELLAVYEKLSDTLQAEIPLKRIWAVAETEPGD